MVRTRRAAVPSEANQKGMRPSTSPARTSIRSLEKASTRSTTLSDTRKPESIQEIQKLLLKTSPLIFFREWVTVLLMIMIGCCSSVITLETLTRSAPKSGNLITVAQFIAVSIEGLFYNIQFSKWVIPSLKPRIVPLKNWLVMVGLFWCISVMNNLAFGYRISMPFHIIFRSASLIMSMLVSWAFFGRKYSFPQVCGVILVTVGIVVSTYASAGDAKHGNSGAASFQEWMMGMTLLVSALILTSILGQYQQKTYGEFGAQWREGLFYIHAFSLPGFLFFYSGLKEQVATYNASPVVAMSEFVEPYLAGPLSKRIYDFLGGSVLRETFVPELWAHLVINVATQYFCISGVQKLSSMTSSVTLNLVLTIRKFISLVISIILFKNTFTLEHGIGASAVFLGTLIYSFAKGVPNPEEEGKDKKAK